MSKPWGGVGAWALEAERAEAEERDLAASAPAPLSQPPQSFPSLKEAAAAKPKKKKPVTMPLTQFVADPHIGFTHDELLRLPTRPRERGPEELEYAGRRGFSSYGGGGGGGPRRGFDDEPRRERPPPRAADMDIPSRADEVDNWAAGKKQLTPMDHGRGHDRYGSLAGSSRADEVDNWAAGKKPMQSFGSGYRSNFGGGSSDPDRWVRGGAGGGGGGGISLSNGDRKRLVLDPLKKDGGVGIDAVRTQTRPSPFGAARPREAVLAEKGVDWRKIDSEIETKMTSSRPTSSHSSRPSSAQSSRPGTPGSQMGEGVKPRPKVNPFGDAKPREILLQEKGKDWRKIDLELEHRGIDRPETEEEMLLKDEINNLKSQEENLKSETVHISSEELAGLQEQIIHKERELELLIRQLDDKVRFGQRAAGSARPVSGAGRVSGPLDARPHSRSGAPEGSRSSEFMERPQSHGGMADAWAKPAENRRGFQSGYFGDRILDRPKSGGRW